MESKDRKRPRSSISDQKNSDDVDNHEGEDNKAPPPYGSHEYWEERYKKLKESKKASVDDDEEDDPDPFHAWYFNYEELAPILLPLILGDESNDNNGSEEEGNGNEDVEEANVDEQEQDMDAPKNGATTEDQEDPGEENVEQEEDAGNAEEAENGETGDDAGDEYEEVVIEDDDEDAPIRIGLAKNGPISILEVGCGDVPLGRDLAKGVADLEDVAGIEVTNIVSKVVCTDYSKCVIDTLQEEQQQKSKLLPVPLSYEVVDARQMPYDNESFELLIEKGTLDAMLSDREKGTQNCQSIVAECARVLTVGGYFVIVSHLNAHAQKGLQWLDDIVVPGLRKGIESNEHSSCKWNIEVHGNDADVPSDKDDDENDGDDSMEEQSHGPAVYVIQKLLYDDEKTTTTTSLDSSTTDKETGEDGTNSGSTENQPPPIDLRFFSY